MSNQRVSKFDDETIRSLFGAQAAEDEDIDRLRSYFVRNKAYERAKANIPLRLLVGAKGIGKSALLKICHSEDADESTFSIWLQPNDISKSWSVSGTFVDKVEGIKSNLLQIIAEESLNSVQIFGTALNERPIVSSVKQLFHYVTAQLTGIESNGIDRVIADRFLKNRIVRVYIDDIDRGWGATRTDVDNISALINATRDLSNEDKNLQFRIGIRTDAYNLVRENDESGDKFEPYVVPIVWSNHDILVIMAKRVSQFFGDELDTQALEKRSQVEISSRLYPIIIEKFAGFGHWGDRPIHNVLLSLTRRRPRDLIKLLTSSAIVCDQAGRNRISTSDLEAAFPEYSKGRISDIISEFKSELPDIQKVVYGMKPTAKEQREKTKPFIYSNDELIKKLNGIASNQNISFKSGLRASGQSLAEFLFKIDFIVARKDQELNIERLYYSDHPKLITSFVDFGFHWEVHPAYRWALSPSNIDELLKGIE